MKQRILSIILILTLILTMSSFAPMTASAGDELKTISVQDAKGLKDALTSGGKDIILAKNITVNDVGDVTKWCTTAGNNAIDLNGYTITVNQDNVKKSIAFFIPKGSSLVIYDDSKNGGGAIRFTAGIDERGTMLTRDVFSVEGKLTVNGGSIEAGRSVSNYSAYYGATVYRQTYGDAILVHDGGSVLINGGTFYGRGHTDEVIYCEKNGEVVINHGTFSAKGGANIAGGEGVKNFIVRSGDFSCETLGAIKAEGKTFKGPSKGTVGIPDKCFTQAINTYGSSTAFSASRLQSRPISSAIHTLSCNGTMNNGTMVVKSDNPVIICDFNENNCIWRMNDLGHPNYYLGNKHDIIYKWTVYDSSMNAIGYAVKRGETADGVFNNTLNLNTDLVSQDSGYVLNLAKYNTYVITCDTYECLENTRSITHAKKYNVCIKDDLAAPTITKNLDQFVTYYDGAKISLSIAASGTNIKYEWFRYDPKTGQWSVAPGVNNQAAYSTPVLTSAENGASYFCKVSNDAGSVTSGICKVYVKNRAPNPVISGLKAPVSGDSLDYDAFMLTPGGKITDISWNTYKGGKCDKSFIPYAGLTMYCDVIVEFDPGVERASGAAAVSDWGGVKSFSTSIPSATSYCYTFKIETAPPESGKAEIENIQLSLEEPVIGKSMGAANMVGVGFEDTIGSEIRYSVFGGTKWYCNGAEVKNPILESFAADKDYKVEITAKPSKGWEFTDNTKAEVNGEPASAALNGSNLVITVNYSTKEASDAQEAYVFPFKDVQPSDWFYADVYNANKMGLIDGKGGIVNGKATLYQPNDNMTYAEAIKLAACMNQIYNDGKVTLTNGSPWYQSYVDYAKSHNIPWKYPNYDAQISRADYVHIFYAALPGSNYKAINSISKVPDMTPGQNYYNEILTFYNAGILTGDSNGNKFLPGNSIKRSEVAAILSRMMDSSARKSFIIQ